MAVEKDSASWRAVKAHCEKGIESGRDALEASPTNEQSNFLRGRIRAFREVLALADELPPMNEAMRPY